MPSYQKKKTLKQRDCISDKPVAPLQQPTIRQRRVRHQSLSVENQKKFEAKFNEIDQNQDGVIEQKCIVKVLEESSSAITAPNLINLQP